MNITRHVAKDMRSALALVRDIHGPDAVILSNRRVPEGIEITAATDYDESLLEDPTPEVEKYTFPSVDDEPANPSVPHDRTAGPEREEAKTDRRNLIRKPKFEYKSARQEQQLEEHSVGPDFKVELSSAVQQNYEQLLTELPDETAKTTEKVTPAETPEQGPEVVWTQNSLLDDMRRELQSLKSLVENQISGFAWGEMSRKTPVRAGVLRKLVALGLTPAVARHIAFRIQEELGHRKAWYRALAMFARQIPIGGDTILTNGGVVALVGPPGVGKTTLIAKLAVQYAARHGRENVALITTDSQRFGAFDQLRNLGSVLKVPVRAVEGEEELEAALDAFLEKPLVLIDSAGLSHRDERLDETLNRIRRSTPMLKAYMVLSATTQAEALEQSISAFRPVNPCGCMITKVDESTSLGPVLSAVVEHKLAISYFSEGQKIPDDLKIARVEDLIGKAVAIAKDMNAFDRVEDVMMEQMLKGEMS